MAKWAYQPVVLEREERDERMGYWVQDLTTPSPHWVPGGLGAILNEYGGQGWELVSLIAKHWEASGVPLASFDVDAYLATFKRRM